MRQYAWTLAVLACLLGICCNTAESRSVVKREAHGHEEYAHHGYADKKKVEQAFGIKNAILGFVFNKINSFIDQKTAWLDHLDHTNIAKNKAQGIEPPKDPVLSLSGIISEIVGQKLQKAGPLLTIVTNKLTSGSTHGSAHGSSGGQHAGAGFNLGALLGGGVGAPVAGHPAVHAGGTLTTGYGAV